MIGKINLGKASAIIMLLLFATGLFMTAIETSPVSASGPLLNLPMTSVTLKCFNGSTNGADSYFISELSTVSSGYDVATRNYSGWCVDRSAKMQLTPATHQVLLYSTLNPPSGLLANQSWNMVNYVLNHKHTDSSDSEIQDAIWYFVNMNGGYTQRDPSQPFSATTKAMINDASSNGASFVPNTNQVVAVIAYPPRLAGSNLNVQISIIEVPAKTNAITPTPTNSPPGLFDLNQGYLIILIAALVAFLILIIAIVLKRRSK